MSCLSLPRVSWVLLAVSVIACQDLKTEIAIRLPAQLQTLDVADIRGNIQVFRRAQACEGKARYQADMKSDGQELTASLRVAPGTHFFCITYMADNYVLGRYVDIEVLVEVGELVELNLRDYPLVYRDLDDDGDRIPNLDELRFGFSIDAPNEDAKETVAMPRTTSFLLGADDAEASVVEQPTHAVEVAAFAIDTFEVSRARYRLCVAKGYCVAPGGLSEVDYLAEQATDLLRLPATGMPRSQAETFCREIAGGRLPTEQEWEYAARANETLYPWGDAAPADDDSRCDMVNARHFGGDRSLGVSYPCTVDEMQRARPLAVDHYQSAGPGDDGGCARRPGSTVPNGACQMAGNVWEWTTSEFAPYPDASWSTGDTPLLSVIRGGSVDSLDHSLRSTFRVGVADSLVGAEALARLVGFRCVYAP